jgi:hypothetical protein
MTKYYNYLLLIFSIIQMKLSIKRLYSCTSLKMSNSFYNDILGSPKFISGNIVIVFKKLTITYNIFYNIHSTNG